METMNNEKSETNRITMYLSRLDLSLTRSLCAMKTSVPRTQSRWLLSQTEKNSSLDIQLLIGCSFFLKIGILHSTIRISFIPHKKAKMVNRGPNVMKMWMERPYLSNRGYSGSPKSSDSGSNTFGTKSKPVFVIKSTKVAKFCGGLLSKYK